MSQRPLRVGVMPYLLGRPLVRGLMTSPPGDVEVRRDTAAQLGLDLLDGKLDTALAPIAQILATPGLEVIPGLGVACDGPVQSIRLYHKLPLPELRRVALDACSRSAALLTQILLGRFEGVEPEYLVMPPDLTAMLDAADAALLIGDNALKAPEDSIPYVDLGEWWRMETGLGFVFAMWALRPGLPREDARRLAEIVYASVAAGEREIEAIVEDEAAIWSLPKAALRSYLLDHIRYRLNERILRGLEHFLALAVELGLLPEGTELPRGAVP